VSLITKTVNELGGSSFTRLTELGGSSFTRLTELGVVSRVPRGGRNRARPEVETDGADPAVIRVV